MNLKRKVSLTPLLKGTLGIPVPADPKKAVRDAYSTNWAHFENPMDRRAAVLL